MKISGEKLRKLLKYSIVIAIAVSIFIKLEKLRSFGHDIDALNGVLWKRNADQFLKECRRTFDSIDRFMEQVLDMDNKQHRKNFEKAIWIASTDVQLADMCSYFETIADFSRAIFLRGYFSIEDDDEEFKNLLENAPHDLKEQHEMDVRYNSRTTYAIMQFLKDFRFKLDLFLRMFEQKSKSLLHDDDKFYKAETNLTINEYQCTIFCLLFALDVIAIIAILRHTKKMLYFYFLSVFMIELINIGLKWWLLRVVISYDVIQYKMDKAKILFSFEKPQLVLHIVLMFGLLITLNDTEKSLEYLSQYLWPSDTKNQRIPEPITSVTKAEKKTQDIFENFICPVCFELMKAPLKIYSCRNDHFICSTCLNKPIIKCPICRDEFKIQKPTRRRSSEQLLSNLLDS